MVALCAATLASAQTLARPGWAGSGLTVERWWRDAVLYEVEPAVTRGSDGALLDQVTARLDDLRALGVDALLLRGVTEAAAGAGAAPISARYGSLEQFDRLLTEASQRHLRVVVELRTGDAAALAGEARFWLSRGVTGLYLAGAEGVDERAAMRSLRGVLRGFVGERVLVGDAAAFRPGAAPAPMSEARETGAAGRGRRERGLPAAASGAAGGGAGMPDLLLTPVAGLGGASADLPAMRASLEAFGRGRGAGSAVATIAGDASPGSVEEARAAATVLLSVRGGVLLGQHELGLDVLAAPAVASGPAAKPGAESARASGGSESSADSLVAWTTRMIGLHRGNAALRRGAQTILDRDAEGVLVVVWRGAGAGSPVLVEAVNLKGTPVEFALTDDVARMRLRGSFLRTMLRSDEGMGAMPLRAVRLAGYGVYLGELSR